MNKEEMKMQEDGFEKMMEPYYKKASEFLESQEKGACDEIKAIIRKAIHDAMPEINHVAKMYKAFNVSASITDEYGHYFDLEEVEHFINYIDFYCGIKYDFESLAIAFMNAENEVKES